MDTRHRILIVDDEAGFRKTLTDILRIKGYTAQAVDRGATALEQVAQERTSVVLIDLQLGDMSGLDLMREIKQIAPETECILLTGYASQSSAIEAVNLGAYGYLQKPYDIDQLLLLVHRALERQASNAALQRVAEQRQRLLHVAQAMLSTLDFDAVIQKTRQSLDDILPYDTLRLYWLEENARLLWPLLAVGVETVATLALGEGIIGSVALTGQGERIADAQRDPRAHNPAEALPPRAHVVCLPLRTQARTIGALMVGRSTDPPFTEEEFELLQLFTGYVSMALENARLFDHVRLSEKRYRTLFEESKDAIVIISPGGAFVDVNPAAVELSGYPTREALLQANVAQHIDTPDAYLELFRRALTERGYVKDVEAVLRRSDGQKMTVLGTVTAVHDDRGEIVAYQAIVRDITERQQLEAQLRQAQKMEAIGRLAGGVAHDFNNILTAIIGYSYILLESLSDEQEFVRKDVEQISLAAERAAALTRQLLAFSRKQVLQPRVLNLNQVVAGIEKMLKRLIGEDIELVTVLESDLWEAKADPGQMEQVIMNLAVNARDAMPHGGRLTITTANVELDANYVRRYVGFRPGPYVRLTVNDTGHGMDEATAAHIFEPFFTTKEPGKGTGLGLATVHGIVTQSDGHIAVFSEPGQGAAFDIYLPQAMEPAGTIEPTWPSSRPARAAETVLLVEDNDLVRDLVQLTLTNAGYQTMVAGNGADALVLCDLHQGTIHLLVTDVVMPGGISGHQLAERLVARYPRMKVLYLSGYTDASLIPQDILSDGFAFLQKPFTPDALARKVREVLEAEDRRQ